MEAALDRFVDLSKDFNGKARMLETGIRSKCVTVLIDGPEDTDPWGKEALLVDGKKVGRLTSGGYSVAFGKQIGMGYVRPDLAEVGTKLKVKMLRQEWDAVVVEDSPFDPTQCAYPGGRLKLGAKTLRRILQFSSKKNWPLPIPGAPSQKVA